MKTYKVKSTFTFTGEFFIKAKDKDEAKQIVEQDCGMTYGAITSSGDGESIDWDFDMTPEKRIKSITLKRKSPKQK